MKDYFIYILLIFIFFSCKKEDKDDTVIPPSTTATITGKAQKGPFKTGSDVVIYELNSSLEQTGVSHSTTITNDAGDFSFNNIAISTIYAMITVTGYYHIEHYNLPSPYRLYLEAISDLQSVSTINVNLLTHLTKPRIEKLVADGNSFPVARTQAQNELKTFLHASSSDSVDFEKLDIATSNFLFAVSLLFQRRTVRFDESYNYTNWLNELLIRFRSDFRDNGQIDSQSIIDTLIYNAQRIELIDDKVKMETYMSSVGITTSVTGFDEYILTFQRAYSSQLYTNMVFPDSAYWDTDEPAPRLKRNVLLDTAAHFRLAGSLNDQYLMTAIVPFDSSLVIKVTKLTTDPNSLIGFNQYFYYGWLLTPHSNGFSIEAQRKNYPNGLLVYFWGAGGADSARVEYFMNNQPTPYFSKIIYW